MHRFVVVSLNWILEHEFVLKCGIMWPFVPTMYEGSLKVALHGTAQLNDP